MTKPVTSVVNGGRKWKCVGYIINKQAAYILYVMYGRGGLMKNKMQCGRVGNNTRVWSTGEHSGTEGICCEPTHYNR